MRDENGWYRARRWHCGPLQAGRTISGRYYMHFGRLLEYHWPVGVRWEWGIYPTHEMGRRTVGITGWPLGGIVVRSPWKKIVTDSGCP